MKYKSVITGLPDRQVHLRVLFGMVLSNLVKETEERMAIAPGTSAVISQRNPKNMLTWEPIQYLGTTAGQPAGAEVQA